MAKAYWIAHIEVIDPEGYKGYIAAAYDAVRLFGGRHIVRGGVAELREGTLRPRHAVVEFPSYAQAVACYQSEVYQQALSIRNRCAKSDLTIVEGYEAV
jgi:uncharacterized protein (DUF1330 family)